MGKVKSGAVCFLFGLILTLPIVAFSKDSVICSSPRPGDYQITLTQDKCESAKVLSVIPDQVREYFYIASASIGGKDFQGCWAVTSDGTVILVYEDGDMGRISASSCRGTKVGYKEDSHSF